MSDQLALLPGYLAAHLRLSLTALALGLAVSLPAGVWAARRPRVERLLLGLASVAQTVPGLALLAIMVPLLAALGRFTEELFGLRLASIGFLPALLALTLYSLLPILRNTVTGLAGVDPAVLEAARAVGMTRHQRLFSVELPLALPVIVAGVRTATVWVVGTATLSTPVGAPSLGNFIFSGLQTRNLDAVLVGCVAAAALALLLDGLVRMIESGLVRRRRGRVVVAAIGLATLLALPVGLALADRRAGGPPPVRIGAKTFTEQYVLAELLALQIERRAGATARVVASLGSTVAFDALAAGEIDLYVEYTGTLWATVMKRSTEGAGRDEVLAGVESFLAERHRVAVAAALGFENAYALAIGRQLARELGIETVGQLADVAPRLAIGADYEFFARREWRDLEAAYGLAFGERRSMDPSLMYQAAGSGEVDVISAFSTDGRIAAYDLVVLDDELGVIPPYDAIVLAGPDLVAGRPRVMAALAELGGAIDDENMRRANLAVDRDGVSPREAAAALLQATARSAGDGGGR